MDWGWTTLCRHTLLGHNVVLASVDLVVLLASWRSSCHLQHLTYIRVSDSQ